MDCLNVQSERLEAAVTTTQVLFCVHTVFFSEPEVKLGETRGSEVSGGFGEAGMEGKQIVPTRADQKPHKEGTLTSQCLLKALAKSLSF